MARRKFWGSRWPHREQLTDTAGAQALPCLRLKNLRRDLKRWLVSRLKTFKSLILKKSHNPPVPLRSRGPKGKSLWRERTVFDPKGTNAPAGLCPPHWWRQVGPRQVPSLERVCVLSPRITLGNQSRPQCKQTMKATNRKWMCFQQKRGQFFAIVEKIKIANQRVVTVVKKGTALWDMQTNVYKYRIGTYVIKVCYDLRKQKILAYIV